MPDAIRGHGDLHARATLDLAGEVTMLTILLIIIVLLLLFGGFGYSRRGRGRI